MLTPLLLLFAGLVILTVGAELLVRGASKLALRFGMSALVVGLTVVAFGTSAPELAVTISASLGGNGAIAVGNIVGSNIFNVACILGVASLIYPLRVDAQVIRREMPIMLAVSLLFPLLLMSGNGITRWEGCLLFAGVVAYTALSIWLSKKETLVVVTSAAASAPTEAVGEVEGVPTSLPVLSVLILIGLGLLLLGSKLMVDNAVLLARRWGISDAIVGLTIVSAGTSLPELATSVVAALRKQADIAVGNIVGSNIFNVLCIGGAAGIVAPPVMAGGVTTTDFVFMIGTSLLVLPLMRTDFSIKRWEGAVLLACYVGYLFVIWPSES